MKKRKPFLPIIFLICLSCRIDAPGFPQRDESRYTADGYAFLNVAAFQKCDSSFWAAREGRVTDSFYSNGTYFYHVAVPEAEAEKAAASLKGEGFIAAADIDTVLRWEESPAVTEPLFATQYAAELCRLRDLYEDQNLTRKNRVAVAIADSGINPLHEEVTGVFRAGWSAFSRSAGGQYTYLLDDLSTNREVVWAKITDTVSWDAVTGSAHGTAVASVIGGNGSNRKGFSGVVPDMIDIYVLKAFASNANGVSVPGSGSSWALYSGLQRYVCGYSSAEFEEENPVSWKEWTQKNGSPYRQKVLPVNISVGASVASGFEMFVLKKLWENDAVVIAASGNEGLGTVCYPSAYSFALSVGAVDPAGIRAPFSNYGDGLDLSAPGVSVPIADGTGQSGYRWSDGTSFAAPFVTGVAAWMVGVNPDLTKHRLISVLKASVNRPETVVFQNGFHREYGTGYIDALKAVSAAKGGVLQTTVSTADLEVAVKESDTSQSGTFFFYLYDEQNRLTAAHPAGTDGTVFFAALVPGAYRLTIQVPDSVGKVEPSFMTVTVSSDAVTVDGFASGETPVFYVTYR